jgi:hypothetical protein
MLCQISYLYLFHLFIYSIFIIIIIIFIVFLFHLTVLSCCPLTPMSSFASSSQARFWTFSPSALASLCAARRRASAALVARAPAAQPAGAKRARAAVGGAAAGAGAKRARGDGGGEDGGAPAGSDGGSDGDGESVDYISVAEEEAVVDWSARALLRLCRCAGLDLAVTATASVYLRRFYVSGLLAEYPPPEMVTASVFVAIKTEACPYTEYEKLSRVLARVDADWRTELDSMLLGAASADARADGASAGDANEEEVELRYLANEAPLLRGLRFHLCVYAPFRPLLALLARAVAAGVGGAERDASARAVWDDVQARALAVAEASLTLTPLALTLSPAELAAAALLAAASQSGLTLVGAGGLNPADGSALPSVALWPSLKGTPEPAVAARIDALAAWLRGGALEGADVVVAAEAGARDIVRALENTTPAADAVAFESVSRLSRSVDPSLCSGTPAHSARLANLRSAADALKAKKMSSAEDAAKAAAAVVQRENAAWGTIVDE